jgi:hypothetical protein
VISIKRSTGAGWGRSQVSDELQDQDDKGVGTRAFPDYASRLQCAGALDAGVRLSHLLYHSGLSSAKRRQKNAFLD